jgi:hypothetical protein
MRCGHSYHSACIIGCFRSGKGCPTCREEIIPTNTQLFFLDSDDFEINGEPDAIVKKLDDERMILRVRNHKIRKAREKLNKSAKSYRIFCESLKIERKALIKNALKDFIMKRVEYNRIASLVRKNLADVKKVEYAALMEKYSEEELSKYDDWVEIDYDPKEFLKVNDIHAPDPLTKKFWRG